MAEKIKLFVNEKEVESKTGSTILEVCQENGIYVPTLCFLKDVHNSSQCRICAVEVEGQRTMQPACSFKVFAGMKVTTNSQTVKDTVKCNLEFTASNHTFECWNCNREEDCELLDLLRLHDIEHVYSHNVDEHECAPRIINECDAISFDSGKCTLCARCVSTCKKITGLGILSFCSRGSEAIVAPDVIVNISESGCIYCGRCIQSCPVSAIKEKRDYDKVIEVIESDKTVIVQFDNTLKYSLFNEVTDHSNKLSEILGQIGFDYAFDMSFGNYLHDYLVKKELETSTGLIDSSNFDLVRYLEQYKPKAVSKLSKVKSPHTLQGYVLKHCYQFEDESHPEDIVVVSVLPNIASKAEINRKDYTYKGNKDVDIVITFRELESLMKKVNVDLSDSEETNVNFGVFGTVYNSKIEDATYVNGVDNLNKLLENDFERYVKFSFDKYKNLNSGGNHFIKSIDSNIQDVLMHKIESIEEINKPDDSIELEKIEKILSECDDSVLYTSFSNKINEEEL